ncbi:hypothetical protein SAE01_03930 [Segetibacter aerophilus]|uniref:histidine kinase n=2 Tax=Segetibacter aerophilus TaxID=670293 RepID=A0A512B7U6_9BACT|nr:hypothetical protein SAE01_03930 [Segetibacter aerophilus]
MYVIAALGVLDLVVFKNSVLNWVAHFFLLGAIGIAYVLPELRFFRNTVIAVLPFAIVSFLTDVVGLIHTPFFQKIEDYFEIIQICTVAWMIAMLIGVNKQRKALEKERQKREIEEEQNRFIAARRAELETMVAARTSELLTQKEELEHALMELRETQVQLIQKEKMASLGELTAGIAHEIQNPLNFVNNFSEVNKELLDEMEHEVDKGNMAEVKEIMKDIKENEIKISQHGKRADAIVKGMLQHSRLSSGKKEPTDINALADEYLRLSYHGLRAKDKSFNATFKTDFDESIKEIEVIPQDIGRVLLNLINNAFYSVNEKKKAWSQTPNTDRYDPIVYVATKRLDGKVQICVKDNGMGIPQKVLDKIYQPFFTTKPAGQGTGLGLSLSYEILKAHGGELRVETREGEFAQFIMELPFASVDKV